MIVKNNLKLLLQIFMFVLSGYGVPVFAEENNQQPQSSDQFQKDISPPAYTLDPYTRAKWLSEYSENTRDLEGWVFAGFGVLSIASGITLHSFASSKDDRDARKGMHIGGVVIESLGAGLGLWGTYLLLSNETITNELDALDSITRGNDLRKQKGAELLLESTANQERMRRYIKATGAIGLGLASGISPFFTDASASAKVSSAILGGTALTYGIFRFLFFTKAEDFWETYKRDRNEAKRHLTTENSNNWSIQPVLWSEKGELDFGLAIGMTF